MKDNQPQSGERGLAHRVTGVPDNCFWVAQAFRPALTLCQKILLPCRRQRATRAKAAERRKGIAHRVSGGYPLLKILAPAARHHRTSLMVRLFYCDSVLLSNGPHAFIECFLFRHRHSRGDLTGKPKL